jgi:hypothetical protein
MCLIGSLLVVLQLLPAGDDAKRPVGGPEEGVELAIHHRRPYGLGEGSRADMRLCRDGDRSWLLFTAQTPDRHCDCAKDFPFWLLGRMLGAT